MKLRFKTKVPKRQSKGVIYLYRVELIHTRGGTCDEYFELHQVRKMLAYIRSKQSDGYDGDCGLIKYDTLVDVAGGRGHTVETIKVPSTVQW